MNLDREFIKWFYEEQYPDLGCNRRQVFDYKPEKDIDAIDYWMREAFKAGARTVNHEL